MRLNFCLTLILSSMIFNAQAQDTRTNKKEQYNVDAGLALSGYDAVSYFKQGSPVKGKKDLAVLADGITYYFSNALNKEEFKKDFAKYVPQYGGWCAYAMGNDGSKVQVDPETYKIVDGKLYLFYNKFFNNTLKSWNKNEGALKMKADANWQKIFK